MNPSSSLMAPVFTDYQQRSTNLRSKILKNEEQRIQLEQKLRYMSSNSSRSYQRKQIEHIQNYFTRLNQESQRAEQRNLQILNDLQQAQQNLDKLHYDAEHLIHLKNDYLMYLESHYPNWQQPLYTPRASTSVDSSNEYDRLARHIKQKQSQIESDGNLRQSVPVVRQSYDVDSSMLFKHYEDQLKIGLERTTSPSTPIINNEQRDEQSISESNEISNTFPRAKPNGSLRMELSRDGLYFLLDYIEKELKNTIDKKKFYRLDAPTITQKRTILDIANEQQSIQLKELDAATISMVILDQLPSTIRRTTVNKCLLTEEILTANIQDLNKDIIAQMLPEQDRSLWLRLIDHFAQLLKLHIMDSQTLVNKFALAFLPANVSYAHEKAKSLLKHIVEKLVRLHSSSSDDEDSIDRKQTDGVSSSPWLTKPANRSALDDYDDEESTSSSSTSIHKIIKSPSSTGTTPRGRFHRDDSENDFFS